MRAAALVAAVAVVLVAAGCVGPLGGQGTDGPTATDTATSETATSPSTAPATPTPTATPARDGSIQTAGGPIPADATLIYERTTALLGVTDGPTPRIQVLSRANMTAQPEAPPFLTRLGVDYGGRTITVDANTGGGVVRVSRGAVNRSDLPYLLAHEFTHVAQQGPQNFSRRFYTALDDNRPGGIDLALLQRSLAEGAATYAGNAYWTRYVDASPTPAEELAQAYAAPARPTAVYGTAPYYHGYRYLDRRNVSPENLTAVYDDPPRTTEELLHGLAPGSEPPANLTLSVPVDGWDATPEGRVGELGTRLGLRSELNASGAARAADGWGEDRLVRLERDGATAFAWALRWDDRANATAFETGFSRYLDRRATETDGVWRDNETSFGFDRTAPRTTVVFVGAEEFVADASGAGANGVTVTAG